MAIKWCPCKPHPFQDSKYGQNMRVHTPRKKAKNAVQVWRCTVCGKEK